LKLRKKKLKQGKKNEKRKKKYQSNEKGFCSGISQLY
jgi:hypothetical protein